MKRVLIVDDEPSITRLLGRLLEHTGCYVVRAENDGRKACMVARKFEPDIVVTDVMMPGISGGEIAQLMAEDPRLRQIPVLFLTAAVRKEELGGASGRIGGRTFIAKPANAAEVMRVIDRVLENDPARAR